MTRPTTKRDRKQDAEVIAEALKRFEQARTEEDEIRRDAAKDLKFVWGDQWDEQIRAQRQADARPCMTFNRLGGFVQQVSNESRLNRVEVKFSPSDDQADEETAEVWDGLARHIQYNSRAQIAYETGADYAASCSFGFVRLLSDYCDNESFDKELKVAPIADPFSVYGVLVPAIRNQKVPWCFIVDTMSKDAFRAQYPKASTEGFVGEQGSSGWVTEDRIRVAEYYRVEVKSKRKLLAVDQGDGTRIALFSDELPEGVTIPDEMIADTREVVEEVVEWSKITAHEILEETEWPDHEVPVEAILGKAAVVEDKPKVSSVIRYALDAQQLLNFEKTTIAEVLADTPRNPWVGMLGQFKTKAREWAMAARKKFAYLEYDPVAVGGVFAPPPQRQTYEAPIQALSQAALQESEAMKQATSIFDAGLGAKSNETSGIAIAQRKRESDTANMHFLDNVKRAYEAMGRRIARLIPYYYDTARMIRVLGEDETEKIVRVNQQFKDKASGKAKYHRLDVGKYDVTVRTGPAYSTRREESFDLLTQMANADPRVMLLGGDIVFRNSDIPGADELAERYKRALPPGINPDEEQSQEIPPEVQQKLAAAQQIIEQMTAQLNQLSDDAKSRKYDIDSRERIAKESELTKRLVAFAQMDAEDARLELKTEIDILQAQLDRDAAERQAEQQAEAAAAETAESGDTGSEMAEAA